VRCQCSMAITPKVLFALQYDYVEDILQKRDQTWGDSSESLRQQHFKFVRTFATDGSLVMGGAFDPPSDGALIILKMKDRTAAENFAKNDPYVLSGAVRNWKVKPWSVVINSPQLDGKLDP